MRPAHPSGPALLVLLLALLLTGLPPAGAAPATERARARPLIWQQVLADPAVVETGAGLVVAGTGPGVPRAVSGGARRPWRAAAPALTSTPSWVLPGDIWAPDLHQVADGLWVLYYSALTPGLRTGSRCIGAAVASTADGPFTPVSDVPLACPFRPGLPPAEDQLFSRPGDLPASGVIDPSVFVERDGRLFLLYKTQGQPSSIRMLPLSADGLHPAPGKISRMLLRSKDIVENPVLVRRDRHYVLFTSEGWYGDCDYRTTYRVSRKRLSWPSRSVNLLGPVITGLCGPAGADLLTPRRGGADRLYFHGWLCFDTRSPCPRGFRVDRDQAMLPRRGIYAATLRWTDKDVPVLGGYLVPRS